MFLSTFYNNLPLRPLGLISIITLIEGLKLKYYRMTIIIYTYIIKVIKALTYYYNIIHSLILLLYPVNAA
jgi:hypothetical protein